METLTTKLKLELKTLERVIKHPNKDFSLPEVIEFLSTLNYININIETSTRETESKMSVSFPSKLLSEEYNDQDSTIYITNQARTDPPNPNSEGSGRAQLLPSEFIATIRLNKDVEDGIDGMLFPDEITLTTKYPKYKLEAMIKKTLKSDKIPTNWIFNSRPASMTRQRI